MTIEQEQILIKQCKNRHAGSQRKLYDHYYNFGMSIASRYSNKREETEEIANDGFVKLFKNIQKYNAEIPFRAWVRTIFISCAIDHYRKYHQNKKEYEQNFRVEWNQADRELDSAYLLKMIRQLSPQYKMNFVLHVIDGFTHEEIAEKLNISKGTSKSNLSKARKKLKEMIAKHNLQTAQYE